MSQLLLQRKVTSDAGTYLGYIDAPCSEFPDRCFAMAGLGGGEWQRVALDEAETPEDLRDIDLMALHDALEALAALDQQKARIVELRFFGGLTVEEVAHVLEVSKRTVEGDWTHAKAWLRSALDPESQP